MGCVASAGVAAYKGVWGPAWAQRRRGEGSGETLQPRAGMHPPAPIEVNTLYLSTGRLTTLDT